MRTPQLRRFPSPQARQLAAKDVLLGEATPRRELPTSNSPRSIPLAGVGLKSALHDARFGEAWGSNLNSSHVGGAAIF